MELGCEMLREEDQIVLTNFGFHQLLSLHVFLNTQATLAHFHFPPVLDHLPANEFS